MKELNWQIREGHMRDFRIQMGIAALGCAGLITQYLDSPFIYQKWVWFVWGANFITALFAIGFQTIHFIIQREWQKTLRSVFLVIPVGLSHLMIGIFLSIFAAMEPLAFFGPDNFSKHFSAQRWFDLFTTADAYLLLYLTTKLPYFFSKDSTRLSGFPLVRDPLLLLLGAIALPILFLKLGVPKDQLLSGPELPIALVLIVFMPWNLFFSSDVQSLVDDKRTHIQPNQMKFPMQVVIEGARGWGLLMALMGGLFVILSFGFTGKSLVASFEQGLLPGLAASLAFLMAFGIGALFFLAGINLQWARKSYLILNPGVQISQTVYLPLPVTKKWIVSLGDYGNPEMAKRRVGGGSSPRHWVYRIVLKRRLENSRLRKRSFKDRLFDDSEILLLESYVEENFDKAFTELSTVFNGARPEPPP